MFLKVLKVRQDSPDHPWITEGMDLYEGERIYTHKMEALPNSDQNAPPPAPQPRFWRITVERNGGCETIESNPAWRYYVLNNDGKTIEVL